MGPTVTKKRLLVVLTAALVGTFALQQHLHLSSSASASASAHLRRLSEQQLKLPATTFTTRTSSIDSIPPYDYTDIEKSVAVFSGYYARLLLFDGKDFFFFNLRNKDIQIVNSPHGGRALRAFPLLIEGLKTNFPDRFKEGQPPFQAMYTDGDALNLGTCSSHPEICDAKHFPPLMAHGSVPKNTVDFPFVKAFPNWFYGDCVYNWKIKGEQGPCKSWWEREGIPAEPVANWNDLIPTIVWRGSDHAFLGHMEEYVHANTQRGNFPMLKTVTPETSRDELAAELLSHYGRMTPRWRGVMKTIIADADTENTNAKWIDVRFYGKGGEEYHDIFNKHGVMVRDQGMNSAELSKYRYQIDFGGGGGTTWRGTIVKMAMPGVLFHHETSMRDWFFDLMVPWVHYIPVAWDLSDLYERYQWAEANPQKCQEISKNASELSQYLMSPEYMKKLYNELYRDYLGQVIDAYQPSSVEMQQYNGHTIRQHFRNIYDKDGFEMTPLATCDDTSCKTSWNDGKFHEIPYVMEHK